MEALELSVAALASLEVMGRSGAVRRTSEVPDADPSAGNPLQLLADGCLEGLAEVTRLEAQTAALKVRLAATYVQASQSMVSPSASRTEQAALQMSTVAEVACVLTVSEATAGGFLSECQQLSTTLPLTLAALCSGALSWRHARIMCEETAGLDATATAAFEAHFLDPDAPKAARGCPAGELVPARFRAKARSWRERHHPDSIEKRHNKSVQDRRLECTPDRDGMAWLSAYVPADTAAGIWDRATAAARELQGPHESRTLTQLRADVAAAWMLGGVAEGTPSPKAQVLVTVPVFSLMSVGTEPALLDGYGPIPPSMARGLVAEGSTSFLRVLTDPRTGAPLEIGRTSYRIPKTMRHWLRLRDGRCPFPGCNNQSLDNDADHLLGWCDGGTTGVSNLGQPCRKHHHLKHNTRWKPTPASQDKPPGWNSPSGRHYPSEEQDWEPPHWPDQWPARKPRPDSDLPKDPWPDWQTWSAA